MRQAPNSIIAAISIGIAAMLFGCEAPASQRVFIDIDKVLAADPLPSLKVDPLPQPPPASPAVTVSQPGLPATRTTDRTIERLKVAKQIIEENRGKSIASLSSMLRRIYLAQADDRIDRMNRDQQPESDALLDESLAGIRALFERYGEERGPLLAHLGALARSTDLSVDPIPAGADEIEKSRKTRANELRVQIRRLDSAYEQQAQALLDQAYAKIQEQIKALEVQAEMIRKAAESKAVQDAESKARQTQADLSVRINDLVPDALPAVPSRKVAVPGSASLPNAPSDKTDAIFGSLEERRRLIDREVDIWVKTTGRVRSSTKDGVTDATEDFLQWRRAHTVGP